jgi:hypothetical protein
LFQLLRESLTPFQQHHHYETIAATSAMLGVVVKLEKLNKAICTTVFGYEDRLRRTKMFKNASERTWVFDSRAMMEPNCSMFSPHFYRDRT